MKGTKDDDALSIVRELGKVRKITQYLFASDIDAASSISLRKNILEFKRKNPQVNEIDFILESNGGQAPFSYRIIRTLRKNFEKVNIVVAFWAKSAATLLAFGGTTIIMDEYAEFGPLDTQYTVDSEEKIDPEVQSALLDESSLNRIEQRAQERLQIMFYQIQRKKMVKISKGKLFEQLVQYIPSFYNPLISKIDPYQIGERARRLELMERYTQRILVSYNNLPRAERFGLVEFIVNKCPDHGYIIDYDLISLYLPNVFTSASISSEFAEILTRLSILFVENNNQVIYNNFVEAIDSNTALTSPIGVLRKNKKSAESNKDKPKNKVHGKK